MSVLNIPKQTEQKVPEEIVERTDPRQGQFSPSSLSSAQCPRKFYLEKVVGLKSNITSPPLIYGSAIHKAVEFFYNNIGSETLSFDEVKAGSIQEFVNYWTQYPVLGDEKRTLEGGITTINKYCDTYRDDVTEFEESDIEGSQWVPMPNGTMLLMKLDRVAQQGDSVGVVDTKTSSWPLTSYFFSRFEQDTQVSLYYYGMQELVGRCDFIMIDGILVPHKEGGFARRNFFRTDFQIEEALNSYCRVTDAIMYGIGLADGYSPEELMNPKHPAFQYFHQNQSRCSDYGGCNWKSPCIHGMDHPAIGTDFILEE